MSWINVGSYEGEVARELEGVHLEQRIGRGVESVGDMSDGGGDSLAESYGHLTTGRGGYGRSV